VTATVMDLQDQYERRRLAVEIANRTDPRSYTGVGFLEGDELFIRKALSVYNSLESEPQLARGQDEVANPVG